MGQVVGVFAPVFIITLLGYLCGRAHLLGPAGATVLSRFVFFVAMPPLFFSTLARRNFSEIAHWGYLASYTVAILAGGLLFYVLGRRVFKESGAKLSLGIFTAVNGNAGYIGIPVCIYAFGTPLPAILATLVHMIFVYPLLITWIELDLARKDGAPVTSIVAKIGQIFLVVLKNPLLLANFAGVAVAAIGLHIPETILRTCDLLGHGAIPAAVFTLGLTLSEKDVGAAAGGGDRNEIVVASAVKLLLIPFIAFVVGRFVFDLDLAQLGSLVFVAALPSPKNAFILAQRYGVYVRRAAMTVFATTVASAISLPLILYVLGNAGVAVSAP